MANEVATIDLNTLPAHVRNKNSSTMQAMAGGMAGGGFGNRISLRGSRFRLIQNGSDLGALPNPTLDVVVFAMASAVQRFYYESAYEPGMKEAPTCFSVDGKTPSDESPKKQSAVCATCAQNVKGSARQGGGKACAYKKRVVVLSPDDLEGAAYALDVNGQSMFGEQQENQNRFSFKGYYEKLSVHGVDIAAIVTRLSFDDAASVPKLHFSPIRALTEGEYEQVKQRMQDDQVQLMLKDLTNEEELKEPAATPPVKQVEPPKAANKGIGGLMPAPKKGFGGAVQGVPKQPETLTPAIKKPLQIDLSALSNFDD